MSRLVKLLTSIVTTMAIIGVGVVVFIQTQNDEDNYEVTAYFEKAIGLFENSDVTILGVPVGKITAVEPEGDKVRVDMVIDAQYKIPADTHAEIVPISVISDRYVEFDVWEGGPVLKDGATLTVSETEIPAELDDVFLQLKKLLDALKPDGKGELGSLGELIVALDDALEGREQDLKGTLVQGAELTQTLARARGDISGLLINLDNLFAKLAPRAGSIATLNKNFATVMRFLAENRGDIEGALIGLGDITQELGDLVKDNGSTIASLLRRAARITPVVLRNQESIEQSLAWLGVVAEGLGNAYNPHFNATDVRSNRTSEELCDIADQLDPDQFPPELRPILEELIDQIRNELCPTAPGGGSTASQPQPRAGVDEPLSPPSPTDVVPDLKRDCKKAIKKAKRQIRRIEEIGIPDKVKSRLLKPLEKNLDELADNCRALGDAGEDPKALEELLEGLPDDLRELLEEALESSGDGSRDGGGSTPLDDVTGNASGTGAAPAPVDEDEDEDSWIDGMLRFLGVSS